jgi:hypothetical protein
MGAILGRKMKIEFYLGRFTFPPYIWRLEKGSFNKEEAEYYGHTWAIVINFLWFEIQIHDKYLDGK